MGFALIATSAAAVIALPLASGLLSAHMSSQAFVNAVRCTAYQDAATPRLDVGAAKFRLNSEAMRQPAPVVAEAHKAASDIALETAASENSTVLAQRACTASPQQDA
jgi:hypothetical protein